ncbi:MAG TPA: S9 family peptidase [Rhizomicrobium sp.]|jgi:dipeptidyl aminopeptidase/acylaminoacyl peptidase|nr:S9 family peptidase [Rhizomicrobium sp.]
MRRASAMLGAAALFLLGAGGARANPPVESFGNLPFMSHPQLSPDGKHFAALQSLEGRPIVVIYTVNAGPDDKPAVVAPSDWIVAGLDWVKNDRLVVYVKVNKKVAWTDSNLVHTWTRAVSVDLQGGNPALLLKDNVNLNNNTNATDIVDPDLDDPDHVYMQIYVYSDMRSPGEIATDSKTGRSDRNLFQDDLYRVDVETGKEERIATGTYDTKDWFMDGHGHVLARENQTAPPLVDHLEAWRNGSWARLGDYDAVGDKGLGIVGIAGDGTSLVRYTRDASGMAVLTRLDLSGGAETQLYSNPRYDTDYPLRDAWTRRVLGAAYVADKVEFHYFDAKWDGLQKGLEAAFPGVSVHAISWNTAVDELIVAVDAAKQPMTYYFLDRTTHKASKIGSAYPDLAAADLGEMKPYDYKARDGLDIPAYLTLPPGKAPKNLPAIVMPHGGPDTRDALGFDWWAQFLANRGYAVLQPNYRGSSGYGYKFTAAGLHQWGLKMQDDITDGVKKLTADGIADPKRICIVGASYGGYAALAGASQTPDLYACAVSFAGISDLPAALSAERARFGKDSDTLSFWISRIGSPYDDSEQLRATSPARLAAQVRCPVLLLHGEGDTTVPIKQSELMDDALKSAGKQVEFIRFPGEDHYMNLADTRIRVLKETEAFLKKNIGD